MPRVLTPRRPWNGRRIVLGVTGGIAAYKAAQLARNLTQLGAEVDVIMSRAAQAFVGMITFEALTGRAVQHDILEPGGALEHIRLAREADVVCVAPATADFLARAAAGRADDMLSAVLLAASAPVIVCPAMNDQMWAHPQTQANIRHLQGSIGYEIVGPATGPLAFGEGAGTGRLEELDTITEHVGRALEGETPLRGRRVVVTAGPTREPVDPVRVLSNRSSGRMGYALAQAAWRQGADVVLISGPTLLEPPPGPRLRRIETAVEIEAAVREEIATADALIMSAAIADFRPAQAATGKIKKAHAPDTIPLEPAPDVLRATRDARPEGMISVGFALETDDGRQNAREKLASKALDMIVLNELTRPGSGFEVETNQVVIFDAEGGETELPLLPKDQVADEIVDRMASLLESRR